MLPIDAQIDAGAAAPARGGEGSQSQASSDRLTALIGWRVMGLERSHQSEVGATGVMPRLSGLTMERGF